jgi:hypothetical protein
MPAFARDDVQLVLTGLLVFGDEPPFEKVRAEEHESVVGIFGLLFVQTGLKSMQMEEGHWEYGLINS